MTLHVFDTIWIHTRWYEDDKTEIGTISAAVFVHTEEEYVGRPVQEV